MWTVAYVVAVINIYALRAKSFQTFNWFGEKMLDFAKELYGLKYPFKTLFHLFISLSDKANRDFKVLILCPSLKAKLEPS